MRARLPVIVLALVAFLALGAGTSDPPSPYPDSGVFIVYLDDQPVGTEEFLYVVSSDSMFVKSDIRLVLPSGEPEPDTIVKTMVMTMRASDFDPLDYQSVLEIGGHKGVRGVTFRDTAFIVMREFDERGEATHLVRPPGKLFIVDPQVFSMFDLICRDLHDRTFTTRSINTFVLGVRDTMEAATVEDLGTEVLRWGERPVTARKLAIGDGTARMVAWVSPSGRMLRLEAPHARVRVERQAPAVKPPSSRDD